MEFCGSVWVIIDCEGYVFYIIIDDLMGFNMMVVEI